MTPDALRDSLAQARQEREQALKNRDDLKQMAHIAIRELKQERDTLRAALRTYGQHTTICIRGMVNPHTAKVEGTCTCGLTNALRESP